MLRLKSLGHSIIEANEARVTPSAETIFATTLYLIMEAGRPVGRDELTRMVWPGVSETQAQHGLRQVLYKLKSFGATIKADRSSLILSPSFCSTDFAELLEPQPNSVLEALAAKVGGSFLPGYSPELSEQFAAWVERQRDIVHSAVARALVAGMQAKKRVSDWTGAEQFASMCLTIDPLNEEATLTVAEAAALGGSKSKALSILNNYLREIGDDAGEIKLPAALLRRRISEAYQDNIFPVRDAPFVGREEEMAELTRALARAQKGNGSAYVITGEPGIGKTRLVQEFTRVAALQRVHIVRVGCQSHDVRRPLSVFVDMVPKLLALPGALGCSPESMGYLQRLVAHLPEDQTRGELENTSISYVGAKRALFDLLDAILTEKCALLEIEDAQWLDPYSLTMIEELSNRLAQRRLFVILTARISAVVGETIATIVLRPLPTTASVEVATAVANSGLPDRQAFLDWCVSSSGGNPFYLIELLRNGTKDRDAYQAPRSLTRLLDNRVMTLSAGARRLLEVCCVLGKHSTLDRIEALINMSRGDLLEHLTELDARGMVTAEGIRIASRHDLLTSVVVANMSVAARSLLHRYSAAQLEREVDITGSVSLMWECAEHWQMASDASRAMQVLMRCGCHLVDVGMPEEAVLVLQRAEGLATSTSDKCAIYTLRARALIRIDRLSEAKLVIEQALVLKRSLNPTFSPLDELSLMLLEVRWGNFEPISDLASDSLRALSSELTTREERLSAVGWLMTVADNLGDESFAHKLYSRIAPDLEAEQTSVPVRAWIDMVYHSSFGEVARAIEVTQQMLCHSRHSDPPIVTLRHLRNAAHVYRCFSSAEDALLVAHESFDISEQIKNPRAMASSANVIGSILMQMGDIDLANEWLARSAAVYDPRDNTVFDLNNWSHRAELAIRRGDAKAAEEAVKRCVHDFTKTHHGRSRVRSYALETQLHMLKGQELDAAYLKSFAQAFDQVKRRSLQDFSAESLILSLIYVGKINEANRCASEYVSTFRRDTAPFHAELSRLLNRLGM